MFTDKKPALPKRKKIPPLIAISLASLFISLVLQFSAPTSVSDTPLNSGDPDTSSKKAELRKNTPDKNPAVVLGSILITATAAPFATLTPTPSPTQAVLIEQITTPSPTNTPVATATPTPTPNRKTVTLKIEDPEEKTVFDLTTSGAENVCDLLLLAKNEGKIRSLTIDDSYRQSLKSAYVVEINGFRNNWTFTVNGASPRGCSLSTPQAGDVIVWKFN